MEVLVPLRVPICALFPLRIASLGRKLRTAGGIASCASTITVQFTINRIYTRSARCNASRDAHRVIHVSRRPNRVISGLAKPFIATVAQPLRSPPHMMLGSAPR